MAELPLILYLETATTVCSVALSQGGKLLAEMEQHGDYSHAENLTVFVERVLSAASRQLKDIDAVAVSKGPGSYTGLRIGVSAAKGFCYALKKPLIAVNTLEQMAGGVALSRRFETNVLLCPMIDARRMEVYCAFYGAGGKVFRDTAAEVIMENSFEEIMAERPVYFFGDGAEKCKSILGKNANAFFIDNVFPSAKNMIPFAEKAFAKKKFEDAAYFEPFYLKDFVAGKKKSRDQKDQ